MQGQRQRELTGPGVGSAAEAVNRDSVINLPLYLSLIAAPDPVVGFIVAF